MQKVVTDYRAVFELCEAALRQCTDESRSDFTSIYSRFRYSDDIKLTDEYIFDVFRTVLFASGFKAATVDSHRVEIAKAFPDIRTVAAYSDEELHRINRDNHKIINNLKKIKALRDNAIILGNILDKHGTFEQYLASWGSLDKLENLLVLKETLQYTFHLIGPITVYHLLTDFGLNVLKPDRVIVRIFERLGLLESRSQLLKASLIGRRFAEATGHPIRYVDIIFVKYGQRGKNKEFGLSDGICLEKNPKCHLCNLQDYCNYSLNGNGS